MAIDLKYFDVVHALVHELVIGNYSVLEQDGRSGRLSAEEIRDTIKDYGRKLIDITEEHFGMSDTYPIEGMSGVWAIDLPLCTVEEGRSDLTLSFTLTDSSKGIKLEIDDIHVL